MSELETYLAEGQKAGCPAGQMGNFVRAGVVLQPRQLAASAAARLCDRADGPTAIGYGGARGGGKSHWLLAQVGADDAQRVPGLKCLLLRRVGKSNLEHLDDLRRRLTVRLSGGLTVLHRQLLDAYRKKCPGGWPTGPDDGYFLQNLVSHLLAAERLDDAVALLTDLPWVEAKCRSGLVFELQNDYRETLAVLPEAETGHEEERR